MKTYEYCVFTKPDRWVEHSMTSKALLEEYKEIYGTQEVGSENFMAWLGARGFLLIQIVQRGSGGWTYWMVRERETVCESCIRTLTATEALGTLVGAKA